MVLVVGIVQGSGGLGRIGRIGQSNGLVEVRQCGVVKTACSGRAQRGRKRGLRLGRGRRPARRTGLQLQVGVVH